MKGWIITLCITQTVISALGIFGLSLSILTALGSGVDTSVPITFLFIALGLFSVIFFSGVLAFIKIGNKISLTLNFLIGVPVFTMSIRFIYLTLQDGLYGLTEMGVYSSAITFVLGASMLLSAILLVCWTKRARKIPMEAHFD